jgi:hypothetical protein
VGVSFKPEVEAYMLGMRKAYRKLLSMLEDCLELPPGKLTSLDTPDVQHRLKLIKYFSRHTDIDPYAQGVGAHQDETGWLTFIQEIDEPGLEVHPKKGSGWINAPVKRHTWAVNIGHVICYSSQKSTNSLTTDDTERHLNGVQMVLWKQLCTVFRYAKRHQKLNCEVSNRTVSNARTSFHCFLCRSSSRYGL